MIYKSAKAIGLNSDQEASLAAYYPCDADNVFLVLITLFCEDAFTKGRQLLTEVSDFYCQGEGSPSEKLPEVVEKFKEALSGCEYSLGLGVLSGKVLYMTSHGDISAYLKRGSALQKLNENTQDQLISGFLQEGDRLFLTTNSLIEFLGDEFSNSLDLPLLQWEEEISARLEAEVMPRSEEGQPPQVVSTKAGLILDIEPVEGQLIPKLAEDQKDRESVDRLKSTLATLKGFIFSAGKIKLIVAFVLLIVIASGLVFKFWQQKKAEDSQTFNSLLNQSRDSFTGAEGLASVSPSEAKLKLDEALSSINKALKIKPKDKEATTLKEKISKEGDSILQSFEQKELPLYLDLDLIKKGFSTKSLSLSGEKLLVLDSATQTLVVIDISKKSHQIVAGKDNIGDASFASINGSVAFVFSQDKGVLKIDLESKKVSSVSKLDKGWGKILDIYGFAGNIYLLDSSDPSTGSTSSPQASSGQVWKYLPTESGYSDKREYLQKGVKANFSSALRMQIESSIYVLAQNGEMVRFTRGSADNFSYGGLDKGVKDPKSFFVSSDTDNLYLLDSGNSRLLVLTKTGAYKSQYQGAKFASFADLVVDEKGKKVYLLEGSKIYSVDLK